MAQILQARKPSTVSQCVPCAWKVHRKRPEDVRRRHLLRTFPLCSTYPYTFKHWKPPTKLLYSLQRCSPLPSCDLKAYWNHLILVTGVLIPSLSVLRSDKQHQCSHPVLTPSAPTPSQELCPSQGRIPAKLPSQRQSHSRWNSTNSCHLCVNIPWHRAHTQSLTLQTGLLSFTNCATGIPAQERYSISQYITGNHCLLLFRIKFIALDLKNKHRRWDWFSL